MADITALAFDESGNTISVHLRDAVGGLPRLDADTVIEFRSEGVMVDYAPSVGTTIRYLVPWSNITAITQTQ